MFRHCGSRPLLSAIKMEDFMKLNEVENPKVGDKCISALGNKGVITKIDEIKTKDWYPDYYSGRWPWEYNNYYLS